MLIEECREQKSEKTVVPNLVIVQKYYFSSKLPKARLKRYLEKRVVHSIKNLSTLSKNRSSLNPDRLNKTKLPIPNVG